jgi:uncharacterized integral membrane protein
MTERTMTKADLISSVLLIVFSAAIIASSLGMPTMADRNESPFSGPGVVPAFIGAMLFLLSVTMLIRSMRRGVVKSIAEDKGQPKSGDPASWARIARTVGLCIVYTLLLGRVWFILISFLFVFIFVMMFEYDTKAPFTGQWKKPLFAAILGAATAGLVFFVFQYLFLVNLP